MFLSLNKFMRLGLQTRLIFWFSLCLLVSVVVSCGTIYYFLSNSIRKSDYLLMESKTDAIQRNINSKLNVDDILKTIKKDENLYITIIKANGTPILTYLPEDIEKQEERDHIIRTTQNKIKAGWKIFLQEEGNKVVDFETKVQSFFWAHHFYQFVFLMENDIFEAYTTKLSNGDWLILGKSAEDREEHLQYIRNITYIVIISFSLISLILSFLIARKILRPIQKMVSTIDVIKSGNIESRVDVLGNNDELDQLAVRFNKLMDSNQKLISNLKGTLDNVAHDLKTPITRMLNSAEEALNHKDDIIYLTDAISSSIENGEKIVSLLDAIMDLSEAETGTMSLHFEEIDVHELLEQVVDLYQLVAEDRNIKISLSGKVSVYLCADRIRIAQTITNIVDNALKYSNDNSSIEIGIAEDEFDISISVEDHGKGIPAEEFHHIWERLYRGDQSRATPGMGIGLSVVKAVVTAHKGKIFLESKIGKGSIFKFTIPKS